ncbi:YbfB/YjiJ family MFS transporter [Sphingomonas daechungensis]
MVAGADQIPQQERLNSALWRLALPGFCASLVSIGLARFAYTPLLPALVGHGWFAAGTAAYLGATNLAGYLIGVLGAHAAAGRLTARWVIRGATAVASISLLACALQLGTAWFFAWRTLSGVAGGLVMVLAAPTIIVHVPPARRGLVTGGIFVGIGFGIALSGTLVPLLISVGLVQTWAVLGGIAAFFTLLGWTGWRPALAVPPSALRRSRSSPLQLRGLYLAYGLNALGLVPHMLFLADFIARGLHQGFASAAAYWTLFGMGALLGPIVAGHAVDRWSARATLIGALILQSLSVALPAFGSSALLLICSSALVGACTIGIAPIVLGRTHEILRHHPAAQAGAWRKATASFAIFQATGAYGMSLIYNWSGGDYRLLFGLGAAALAVAAVLAILAGSRRGSEVQGRTA